MDAYTFRKSPERVSAFRELLINNPTLAEAIVVLKDERPSAAAPQGSDALDRAASLARLEQHDTDVNLLLSLAEPLPPEPEEEEANFGVDRSQFPGARRP